MTDELFQKALSNVPYKVEKKVMKMLDDLDQTVFFILMVDGHCCKVSANNRTQALSEAATQLGYDDDLDRFGIDQFYDDLNLIEWKDDSHRYILDYSNKSIETFPMETPYQLEGFLKITKTKKPIKSLKDEWGGDLV